MLWKVNRGVCVTLEQSGQLLPFKIKLRLHDSVEKFENSGFFL
jgi:hypothetical protein